MDDTYRRVCIDVEILTGEVLIMADMKTDETAGKTDESHKPKHSFKKLYAILILILFLVFFVLFVSPRKDEIIGEVHSVFPPVTTETNNMLNTSDPVVQSLNVVISIMPVMILLAVIMAVFGMIFGGPRPST